MCQAGPRWRPNCEIAWHTERLLHHERYTNSKRSPSSNAIIIHSTLLICHLTIVFIFTKYHQFTKQFSNTRFYFRIKHIEFVDSSHLSAIEVSCSWTSRLKTIIKAFSQWLHPVQHMWHEYIHQVFSERNTQQIHSV